MPKKPTVKKSATKKKAPEQTSLVSAPSTALVPRRYSFDILSPEGDDVMGLIKDTLVTVRSKRNNCPTGFKPMSEVRQTMLPLRDFMFQQAIGCFGIPQSSVVEIIGAAGVGKSTLTFRLAGWGLLAGCPVYRIGTEAKELSPERIFRALSTDPVMAQRMLDHIGYDHATTLEQADDFIVDWVNAHRGRTSTSGRRSVNVPIDTPLVVIVDSWSKLMSATEAAGYAAYGDNMEAEKKKKFKETGTGSNMGHAKFAHAWCRKLPEFLIENNIILIIVSHQHEKVDMGGAKGSSMPADTSAIYNITKLGGKALNQTAGLQLILARKGLAKDTLGKPIGAIVRMRVHKNSFGPNNGIIEYELRDRHTGDSPTYIEPAIHTSEALAKWFADERLLGTEASRKRYTCETLGVTAVTGEDFAAAFHSNTAVVNSLGARLGISGYSKAVDIIKEALKTAPPAPPLELEDTPPPPPEEESSEEA